jgi:cysteine desulfuration protein SufE
MSEDTIEAALAGLAEEFAFFPDWEERYSHVIDLGKTLPDLAAELRSEETRVRGCASQVWLVARPANDGSTRVYFEADSDAHIVRGLIAILLRVYSGRTPAEILAVDPAALFDRLGLAEALSGQRANGLRAMIVRVRDEASRLAS